MSHGPADHDQDRRQAGALNIRVAGLAFRNGHVLVHRATHEAFWTFPADGRKSARHPPRRWRAKCRRSWCGARVERLLWMVENFFRFEGRDWHELGFYYLMDLPDSLPFASGPIIHRIIDGKNDIEFKWVPATPDSLAALPVQPDFIAARLPFCRRPPATWSGARPCRNRPVQPCPARRMAPTSRPQMRRAAVR